MSFVLEVKDKLEHARNDMQKKTKKEKMDFLVSVGIVSKSGKLKPRFQTTKAVAASSGKSSKKKASS